MSTISSITLCGGYKIQMKEMPSSSPGPDRPSPPARGISLGTLAGIQIRLDSSLLIIFTLLVYILGGNVFPDWHPAWGGTTTWLTAVIAGIIFFASVLAHELAHSLVAQRFGIRVRSITLFLFGGLAEIEKEPETPRTEFLIAIAGPATSLFLGVFFSLVGRALAGPEFTDLLADDQAAALATLAPLPTLLLWLGPVNILLGLFNLLPGFPLDGGRVLRAAVWWFTGDLHRASRIASDSGRLFGWSLMLVGAVQAMSGAVLGGLWLVMIGWLLANAASATYRQLIVRDIFRGITVRDLMRTHFETIDAHRNVADFVDNYLLQSAQLLWPVTDDDQLVGLATLQEVQKVTAENRPHTIMGQVMRNDLSRLTLAPDLDARQAFLELNLHDTPLAVVEDNRVIGLLSQADTMKWLLLHPNDSMSP